MQITTASLSAKTLGKIVTYLALALSLSREWLRLAWYIANLNHS